MSWGLAAHKTKQVLWGILILLAVMFLPGPVYQLVLYFYRLGWEFWHIALPLTYVLAQLMLQVHTGRGVLHWICVGGSAVDAVICGITPWLWDGLQDLAYWVPKRMAERVAEMNGEV